MSLIEIGFVILCGVAGANSKVEPEWWQPLVVGGIALIMVSPILISDWRRSRSSRRR